MSERKFKQPKFVDLEGGNVRCDWLAAAACMRVVRYGEHAVLWLPGRLGLACVSGVPLSELQRAFKLLKPLEENEAFSDVGDRVSFEFNRQTQCYRLSFEGRLQPWTNRDHARRDAWTFEDRLLAWLDKQPQAKRSEQIVFITQVGDFFHSDEPRSEQVDAVERGKQLHEQAEALLLDCRAAQADNERLKTELRRGSEKLAEAERRVAACASSQAEAVQRLQQADETIRLLRERNERISARRQGVQAAYLDAVNAAEGLQKRLDVAFEVDPDPYDPTRLFIRQRGTEPRFVPALPVVRNCDGKAIRVSQPEGS